MNPFLRTLEDWTTQQDYVWFLALMAWGAVIAGAWQVRDRGRTVASWGWLFALGGCGVLNAGLELSLLSQDLLVPYVSHDFLMGMSQALSGAVLWGQAILNSRVVTKRWIVLGILGVVAVGIATLRVPFPLLGGALLSFWVASGGLRLLFRRRAVPVEPDSINRWWLRAGLCLVTINPVLATNGPLATLAGEGRMIRDFSHFALLAALSLAISGGSLGFALWKPRLVGVGGLRKTFGLLAVWLVAGLAFAIWSGREARLAFEENLLHRATTAAAMLDPSMIEQALGPSLKVESIEHRKRPTGDPVDVAIVPWIEAPVFVSLRGSLRALQAANPDLRYVYLLSPRDGKLILSVSPTDRPTRRNLEHPVKTGNLYDIDRRADRRAIIRDETDSDRARLASGHSFLEGPFTNQWGAIFSAKAPLPAATGEKSPGWLVCDVPATRWTKSFTRARLQAMGLVGAGALLWSLSLAYRLRREDVLVAQRHAAEASAADQLKSAFLATVSHELRTPIQSVLGYGELLERAPLEPQHRGWLQSLRVHGEVMLRLVNDLLDLGAMQSGAFRLRVSPCHLPVLVQDCVTALLPQAEAKGLHLHCHVTDSVPGWIMSDAVRLRQILLNLISNAVKYTIQGKVTVSVSWDQTRLRLVVNDTGPGIPSAQRGLLFRPFTRLPGSQDREGSGIGLALVAGLCKAMSGSVRHEENDQPGSTFVVDLPAREVASPTTSASSLSQAYAGKRILIADDNTLVRELLVAFFDGNGADVIAVADGEAAVAGCVQHQPHAVILDIAMSRLDGIGAARAIRGARPAPTRRPFLLGLSAHAGLEYETDALAAGMDCFMTKPISLRHLASILNPVLGTNPSEPSEPVDPTQERASAGLFARLRAQYQAEAPGLIRELREAFAVHDWKELKQRVHYMKNCADVIGALPLQQSCRALFEWADQPEKISEGTRLLMLVELSSLQPFSAVPAVS